MGVQMLVTRSGETFLHPGSTISEVSMLPRSEGSSGARKNERAFLIRYNDGSKTDMFEGANENVKYYDFLFNYIHTRLTHKGTKVML